MSDTAMDLHLCPICGSSLARDIVFDDRDNLIIACNNCGQYGLTSECYEDEIVPANEGDKQCVGSFLKNHNSDQLRPFISYLPVPAPEGYKNYLWSQAAR